MSNKEQALTMLDKLYKGLNNRAGEIKRFGDYYDGIHPLRFASKQFEQYWGGLFKEFADNWAQVVVDSKAERLQVRGIRLGEGEADEETWRIWQVNGLDADSGLAIIDAIALGRAYALVWGDPDDDDTPMVTFESANEAIVGYESGSRRKRVGALKCWRDEDTGDEFATLYLPDEVWKFKRSRGEVNILPRDPQLGAPVAQGGPQWVARQDVDGEPNPQPNPLGVVPMVELPNRSRLSAQPTSEIKNVIPLQDAINIIWSHTLTASDFQAFPQRVVLGMEVPKKPIVNDAGEVVGHEPIPLDNVSLDRLLWFEDPDAKIASWPAVDLKNYTDLLETAVGHIAAQTRTPQHYLIGKMANLSGEALKAAETGLVMTVYEKQLYFGEAIREIARLIALARDEKAKAEEMRTATVVWKDPESRSLAELADALGKQAVMLHVPDEALWREYGYTDTQIQEFKLMQAEQDQATIDRMVKQAEAMPEPEPPAGQPGGAPPKQKGQPVQPSKKAPAKAARR